MTEVKFPKDKDELVRYIAEGYEEVNALIGSLTGDELNRPGGEGWSIKDHLAHLAAWEAGIVALLNRQPRWDAMGLSEEIVENNDETSMNDLVHERVTRLSADEVRAWFADVHTAMLDTLSRLTTEDVLRPYADYEVGTRGRANQQMVASSIIGNTYGHYAEHLEWMRQLLTAQRS